MGGEHTFASAATEVDDAWDMTKTTVVHIEL
jgi:hypothetical protein